MLLQRNTWEQWEQDESLTAVAALAQIQVPNPISLLPRMCYIRVDVLQGERHFFIDLEDEQSSSATTLAKPAIVRATGCAKAKIEIGCSNKRQREGASGLCGWNAYSARCT